MDLFESAAGALHKVVATAALTSDEPNMSDLLDVALGALDYRNDQTVARRILMSILFHDDLAEAINGSL